MLSNSRPLTLVFRSPLLWGTALSLGFYWLVHIGAINHPLLGRYFASHPVEYIAATMFFVGLAALGLKCLDVARQFGQLKGAILEPPPPGGQPTSHAELQALSLSELFHVSEVAAIDLRGALELPLEERDVAEVLGRSRERRKLLRVARSDSLVQLPSGAENTLALVVVS